MKKTNSIRKDSHGSIEAISLIAVLVVVLALGIWRIWEHDKTTQPLQAASQPAAASNTSQPASTSQAATGGSNSDAALQASLTSIGSSINQNSQNLTYVNNAMNDQSSEITIPTQ